MADEVRLTLVCGDEDVKIDAEHQHLIRHTTCAECGSGIIYSITSVEKILEMNPDKTQDDILMLCQDCTQFKILTTKMLTKDKFEVKALSEEQEKILSKLRKKLEDEDDEQLT